MNLEPLRNCTGFKAKINIRRLKVYKKRKYDEVDNNTGDEENIH